MTDVTIPALPAGVTLTGTEPLETVQANVSVKVPSRYFGLATDPVVLVGADAALTQSRTITAGTGVSFVDSGPGGTLTVNATGIVASTAQFVLLAPEPALPDSRTLTGTANQVILTDNGAGSTVVLSLPQSIATTSSPTFASLTLTNPLTVPNGGTGANTLTGLLQGNGAAAFTAIANSSTVGQVLRVTGAATYAWGALDLADPDAVTGLLPVSNGGSGVGTLSGILQGNGVAAFSAIANSSTVGQVLRVTGASTYAWGALDLADADAVTGALPITNGGTGQTTQSAAFDALSPMTTLGDTIYGDASGTGTRLAGNTTTTLMFLSQTGSGAVSAAPAWAALPGSFSGFANPTASLGLTAINGVATTAMRSDAAPALSQSIAPTWSGTHTFTAVGSTSTTAPIVISNAAPLLFVDETDGGVNQRYTRLYQTGAVLTLDFLNDAQDTPATIFSVPRTGITPGAGTWGVTQHLSGDGAVGAPVYSFSADTNTGMYRVSADAVGLAAGGSQILVAAPTGGVMRVIWGFADGAVGTPGLYFDNDVNTGIYRPGADQLAISAGGSAYAIFNQSTNTVTLGSSNSNFTLNINDSATASAGGATLPANPVGFLAITINGTLRKVPYYAS